MRRIGGAVAIAIAAAGAAGAADILTAQYDNARTVANPSETVLNTSNVRPGGFGRLYSRSLDGSVFAQPLYVHGVEIPGRGARNVVYIATMHNTVYAFDADDAQASKPLWSVNLGPPHVGSLYGPELGILPTPVISRATGYLYVLPATFENGRRVYRLHALALGTGEELHAGPVVIDGSVPGTASDAVNRVVRFDPGKHLVRTGLALVQDTIYFATAPSHDEAPSHGWVFGYDSRTMKQAAIFNDSPNSVQAGIWQSGRAMAADDEGFLYLETGNGDYDGKVNFGQSFLKLSTADGIKVADWFTPEYWEGLNDHDWDIGSTGPLLIPGTHFLAGGSKIGVLFVMDTRQMGHLQRKGRPVAQSFLATRECSGPDECNYITNQAFWNHESTPTLFVWATNDTLKAFRFSRSSGRIETRPAFAGAGVVGYPGAVLAVSSDGSRPGTAILWAATREKTGKLYAFDAADPARQLWTSDAEPFDMSGLFVPPVVADGKVFVVSESGKLTVYGLLSPGAGHR